jgi:hypothetical protein
METESLLLNFLLLLVSVVIAYATKLIREKMRRDDIQLALDIAETAAYAIEQLSRNRSFGGKTKLAAAMSHAKRLGERVGIRLTDEEWRILIEHAVYEINRSKESLRGGTGDESGQVG